jgi:beta-glucosidase
MEGYHEIGGIPIASSNEYLEQLIREEMGFTGMLVTDYREILNLYEFHRVVPTSLDAVELSLSETTIDMSMVPQDTSFYDNTLELVKSGKIPVSRIDDSARRVLELKNTLGLFDNPIPPSIDPLVSTVGQDSDWEKSLNTARESITLLKNQDSVLPFPTTEEAMSIFVTGPTCDSLVRQTGGWSLHWQGGKTDSEFTRGVTVKQGLQGIYGESNIVYQPGPSVTADSLDGLDMDAALAAANAAKLTVVCVGEETYTEKPGDIDDLNLAQGQIEVDVFSYFLIIF